MEIIHPSEIISETFDDARNLVRNALQSKNDWKAFYGIATAAESYLRQDVDIHLHLILSDYLSSLDVIERNAFGGKGASSANLCIHIQRHPRLEGSSSRPTNDLHATYGSSQNCDEAMFIGIVQFMKKKKGMVSTPVPSLVWLKSLNACPETPIDTLKKMTWDSIVPEGMVIPTINSGSLCATRKSADREGRTVEGYSSSILEGELPSETIQGRTEIMSNFSDDYTPFNREGRRTIFNAEIIATCLSVELGWDNTIGIAFKEPLQSCLQGYELALCPLDLSCWPIEWMHMLQYPYGEESEEETKDSKGARDNG